MPVNQREAPAVPEPPDAVGAAQALCRSCGLCCDGTLFSSVSVRDLDVVSPLVAAGIKIVAQNAERNFRLPCAAHDGQSCKVYADRPSICREFRCKLLVDLESRTVDWPRAVERIRQVFALKAAVTEALQRIEPALVGTSLSELRKRWTGVDDAAESLALRQKYGPALVCMVALAWYLEQHFFKARAADDSPDEFSEKRTNTAEPQTASE